VALSYTRTGHGGAGQALRGEEGVRDEEEEGSPTHVELDDGSVSGRARSARAGRL
jgi:hypothetical protein